MKSTKHLIDVLNGRKFNGRYYPRFKRIRTEPRYHIRRLLRSFIPLKNADDPLIDDHRTNS